MVNFIYLLSKSYFPMLLGTSAQSNYRVIQVDGTVYAYVSDV